jgi:hypothetical protein
LFYFNKFISFDIEEGIYSIFDGSREDGSGGLVGVAFLFVLEVFMARNDFAMSPSILFLFEGFFGNK